MVEVTKFNFEQLFPRIENAIKNSSFIAIDTEFTGLGLGPTNDARLFDNMEERYQKLRNRATCFIPCQIGISTFIKSEEENSYFVETYVFFIRPYMFGSTDKKFVCQASSLDFLSRYNFDFNKFINEGIPFINEAEEKQAIKEIEDGTIAYAHEKSMDFKLKREQDMLINNKFAKLSKKKVSNKDQPKVQCSNNRIIFPKDKVFHEYFQLTELRRKYPTLWARSEHGRIVVEDVPTVRREELQKNVKKDEKRLVDFYLGFTKVFRLLKDVKKPIVGHNLLMDLLLFFQNFHRPLPEKYNEFKKELHSVFPIVFDTRYIWLNVKQFSNLKNIPKRSGLFDLYEMFKNPVDSVTALYSPNIQHTNCDKYLSETFPHESGYDSYVTGWIFIKICHLLAMDKVTNTIFIQPQTFNQHLKSVSPFVNKLNIGRCRIRYIYISGSDPNPQVSEFLHISHRTSKSILNQAELSRIFDKYPMVEFKLSGNRKGAIIAVGNNNSYDDVLRDFKDDPHYIVTKYNVLRHSPVVKTTLWLTAMGSGCVIAYVIAKYLA